MAESEARALMQSAWTIRRSSFDRPEEEKQALMEQARDDLGRAVELCRRDTDRLELARALHLLANLERDLNRNDAAMTAWLEAVAVLRDADAPLELAHKVRHVGDLHRQCGRLDEAGACYEEAASLYREHDRPGGLDYPNAIRPYARLKEHLGEREQARALWIETRELYAAVRIEGFDPGPAVADCERHLARLAAAAVEDKLSR